MNLFINFVVAFPLWVILFALRVAVIVCGYPAVLIALPFAKEQKSCRPKKWAEWKLINLPMWAWPWDNKRDGCLGDTSGKYWFTQANAKGDFWKMYEWLALRNPANNFSRFLPLLSANISGKKVNLLAGKQVGNSTPGFMFCKVDGLPYWAFWYVAAKVKNGRRWNIRLGHKVEPRHNGADWSSDPQKAIKGFTFRISRFQG